MITYGVVLQTMMLYDLLCIMTQYDVRKIHEKLVEKNMTSYYVIIFGKLARNFKIRLKLI